MRLFAAPRPDSATSIAPSPHRAAIVFILLIAAFVALAGRVGYLQTIGRQQMIRRAERQHHQKQVLPARRGGIFDRNGLVMAGTVQSQALFVDPKFLQETWQQQGKSLVDLDAQMEALAKLIGHDSYEIIQLVSDRMDERYVKVAEDLDEQTCREISKLNLPGIGFTPMGVRYYPMGALGAHLLGGTGDGGAGLEGLELQFEKLLHGRDGFVRTLNDARHRPIATAAEDYVPPENGQHVMLTIDANIQLIAEQELARTCEEFKAARGEVVVLEPKTGEVLALANWPTFTPGNLNDTPPDLRRNRCLTDPYEPGSTLKPFLVGPALAWGITKREEVWPVQGASYRTPYGRMIHDVHGYSDLTTWDGLVKSSNIVMSMLAERMENPRMHEALSGWQFGKATGIELPGENGGRLYPLKEWTKFSTESVAQGYEIMVTPLQLARAFCAYGNGGRLVQPTLIKGTLDADGHLVPRVKASSLQLLPQVIDPLTAADVKRVLCDVVVRGTGTKGRSDIWNIFGKTGTAHISEGKGGYSDSKYTSSFLGGAPAEDPRLIVAFIVHEPDKKIAHFGGSVSAPGAKNLIERSLAYLDAPASPPMDLPDPAIAEKLWQFNPKVYERGQSSVADARE